MFLHVRFSLVEAPPLSDAGSILVAKLFPAAGTNYNGSVLYCACMYQLQLV